MNTVAIVGTGLIGGSFGLALREAGFRGAILGVSSEGAIAEAVAAGAIDRGMPLAEAVPQADLVFLSQTIGRILDTLDDLKIALLEGEISGVDLDRLRRAVRDERDNTDDPALEAVLDEIELRAAVEVAKLEQASRAA